MVKTKINVVNLNGFEKDSNKSNNVEDIPEECVEIPENTSVVENNIV